MKPMLPLHLTAVRQLVFHFLVFLMSSIADLENVALWKPATQSGLLENLQYPDGSADRAVDGNLETNYRGGSCIHTKLLGVAEAEPAWWMVDLQQHYTVHSVILTNRNIFSARLQNFSVFVSEEDPKTNPRFPNENLLGERCVFREEQLESSETAELPCDRPVTGRYVTVYKIGYGPLVVCEIQVMGEAATFVTSSRESVAASSKQTVSTYSSLIVFKDKRSSQNPYFSKLGLRSLVDCVATCVEGRDLNALTIAQFKDSEGRCECIQVTAVSKEPTGYLGDTEWILGQFDD